MPKKLTKTGLLCGTNPLPHYCHIHIQCLFAVGPNKRIFATITFVTVVFMPHSSCAHSSGPSFRETHSVVKNFIYSIFESLCFSAKSPRRSRQMGILKNQLRYALAIFCGNAFTWLLTPFLIFQWRTTS